MKQSTIDLYTKIFTEVANSNISLKKYCEEHGIKYTNITTNISYLKRIEDKSLEEENLLALYNKLKGVKEVDTDDRARVWEETDEDGKIQYYCFEIFIRDKAPLVGKLSRVDMESIYRLYSFYGSSLTQRQISRLFPEYSLVDFKRILRAFNITKATSPFPKHVLQEHTEEELNEMYLRDKENDFLRKIEQNRLKDTENLLNKYAKENYELKEKIQNRKKLLDTLSNCKIEFNLPKIQHSVEDKYSDTVVFLSDLHIGAYNERYGYLQLESYDKNEISRRLRKVIEELSKSNHNSITICDLGDNVDSFNKQTTRGGHDLPTVLSNKEQSQLYQEVMGEFFYQLDGMCDNIKYICIGESNHSGDWGWINNIVLAQTIQQKYDIQTYVSNNPIDHFDVQNVSFIYLHGTDNLNNFRGFPLVINDKTESWFNNYFLDSNTEYKKKKCVVKGDLHQFAYSCAKHFDYISAPSLYGSSNWIVANFGKTPWGVLIASVNNDNISTKVVRD